MINANSHPPLLFLLWTLLLGIPILHFLVQEYVLAALRVVSGLCEVVKRQARTVGAVTWWSAYFVLVGFGGGAIIAPAFREMCKAGLQAALPHLKMIAAWFTPVIGCEIGQIGVVVLAVGSTLLCTSFLRPLGKWAAGKSHNTK